MKDDNEEVYLGFEVFWQHTLAGFGGRCSDSRAKLLGRSPRVLKRINTRYQSAGAENDVNISRRIFSDHR